VSNKEGHDDPPVIRIIKKGGHAGHHGGAWKVAYADFVTAMMALFIVLWILNQSEDIKRGVGGYFRDPMGKEGVGAGPKNGAANIAISTRARAVPSLISLNDQPLKTLEAEADKLREAIEDQPALKALSGQISVEVTAEGVRIEINESADKPLFESGSARLSPALNRALEALASEFSKVPNPIVIEGHTDSAPYSQNSTMTNWELSTQRANEARRIFEANGLDQSKIFMIRGYADRKPRFNDTSDPRNRRISMLLLSADGAKIAQGSIDTQAASDKNVVDKNDGPEPVILSDPAQQQKPVIETLSTRGGERR
jgi:chemotaxis protein MotB